LMPARKKVVRPTNGRAKRTGRVKRAVLRLPRLRPPRLLRRKKRVAGRRPVAKAIPAGRPAKRSLRRAAARNALHRAALARLRVASAAKAVARAGMRATASMKETADQAAREAVIAIKAADRAVEAALPHSGDKTEEE